MQITASYDTSVTSLQTSNPTLYNGFISATQAAIAAFDGYITNNITININFGYGEVGGSTIPSNAGGVSSASSFLGFNYSSIYSALQSAYNAAPSGTFAQPIMQAALASLSATDPTGGAAFAVRTAYAAMLGLINPTSAPSAFDASGHVNGGSIGLSSAIPYFWSQSSPDTSGNTYDATGILEHEISEILGRVAQGGASLGGSTYTPLDLFRYTATGNASSATPGTAVGARDEPFATGYSASNQSYFSYDGSTVTQAFETPADVASGADVVDWAPPPLNGNDSFGDGGSGVTPITTTDLQLLSAMGYDVTNCFLPGTRIATARGEVAVERLSAGDLVLTADGAVEPITWIGMAKGFIPRGKRNAATPIVIRKGALADNVPYHDLYVTKGHSLFLDGVLIPAEYLVNHRSILWDDREGEVTVFHIELPRHSVLLANGAPAETYRDDGNAALFHNADSRPLFPDQPPCAPVLTGGAEVDAIWRRLLDRTSYRGYDVLSEDPDLHLEIDGRRLDGAPALPGRFSFRVPHRRGDIHIVSRASAPDELGLARDSRRLGVGISRIVIWRSAVPTVIDFDDERLCAGFHGVEPDNGYRWTDGEAVLPVELFDDDVTDIDLYLAGSMRYPVEQVYALSA